MNTIDLKKLKIMNSLNLPQFEKKYIFRYNVFSSGPLCLAYQMLAQNIKTS